MNHQEQIIPWPIPDHLEGAEWDWWDAHAHIWRYLYAADQKNLGRVADAACGYGYGTEILLRAGHNACGFDINRHVISRAQELYPALRGRLAVLDLESIDATFGGFNTMVSFETLEHIEYPHAFLQRLTSVNTLICSVPVIPTVHINPHHKHDFTLDTFGEMIDAAGFRVIETQLQSAPTRKNVYAVVYAMRRRA